MISYDETKRKTNIKDHGLDFVGCEAIFSGPVLSWEDDSEHYFEPRINTLGFLNGVVVHMTYTERGEKLRVISLIKAEKHEIKFFIQRLSR